MIEVLILLFIGFAMGYGWHEWGKIESPRDRWTARIVWMVILGSMAVITATPPN